MDSLTQMNAILAAFANEVGKLNTEKSVGTVDDEGYAECLKLLESERDGALKALIEGMKTEVATLKVRAEQAEKPNKLTLKVSNKGAVSVYGLQRFPITLHREQWERVISMGGQINEFIKANESILRTKGEDDAAYEKRTGRHVTTDAERAAEQAKAEPKAKDNTYRTGDGENGHKVG